jgi:hypothetical protein
MYSTKSGVIAKAREVKTVPGLFQVAQEVAILGINAKNLVDLVQGVVELLRRACRSRPCFEGVKLPFNHPGGIYPIQPEIRYWFAHDPAASA